MTSSSKYPATGLLDRRSPRATRAWTVGADAWILAALVGIAAAIRIITLDSQSLWADEALTAYEARLSLGAMLHTVVHVEVTPPLYFVVVWGWAKLFGSSVVALRSVSAIAGVAMVPIAYASARELVSRRAGVLAAALVVCNPFMIWYSQEARSYMLLATLTGAAFWCFARALRDPSWRNLGWWAGLSAAAVMTHFFAGFAVLPEALWLLWRHRTRATAIAVAVVAAAQVAMLPFLLADAAASRGVGWIARVPRSHRVAQMVIEWIASTLYRRTTTAAGLAGGAALVLVVVALLVAGGERRPGARVGVAAGIAGIVFAAPLALGFVGQDYFLSRNEIPAFIPVVTVLAAACVTSRARAVGVALAAALIGVFSVSAIVVQTHPYLQRANWRAAAGALGPATTPRAVLAAGGTTADALKIYLPGVNWTQPIRQRVSIGEIDVVGTRKRQRVLPASQATDSLVTILGARRPLRVSVKRSPTPRSLAPPGARLLTRHRVKNWIIARFALTRPRRLSIASLRRLAPRFFGHTPVALLVFTQPRQH